MTKQMIIYEGQKYACLSCIRGHRSSSCDHKDRVLLKVRKRGRPLNTAPQGASLLPYCERSTFQGRTSDLNSVTAGGSELRTSQLYALNESSLGIYDPQAEETTVYYTDKYSFVPVGNGLYRKEKIAMPEQPNSGIIIGQKFQVNRCGGCCSSCLKFAKIEVAANESEKPDQIDSQALLQDPKISNETLLDDARSSESAPATNDCRENIISRSIGGFSTWPQSRPVVQNDYRQRSKPNEESIVNVPMPRTSEMTAGASQSEPPSVIGPMHSSLHLLAELRMTQEEIDEFWPGQNLTDFAPLCVIPGQCQCGDTCQCPKCFEHGSHVRDN